MWETRIEISARFKHKLEPNRTVNQSYKLLFYCSNRIRSKGLKNFCTYFVLRFLKENFN